MMQFSNFLVTKVMMIVVRSQLWTTKQCGPWEWRI